jgi:hypothetical protein
MRGFGRGYGLGTRHSFIDFDLLLRSMKECATESVEIKSQPKTKSTMADSQNMSSMLIIPREPQGSRRRLVRQATRNQEGVLLIWRLTQGKGIVHCKARQGREGDRQRECAHEESRSGDRWGACRLGSRLRQQRAALSRRSSQEDWGAERDAATGWSEQAQRRPPAKEAHPRVVVPNQTESAYGGRERGMHPRGSGCGSLRRAEETAQHVSRAAQRARFELRRRRRQGAGAVIPDRRWVVPFGWFYCRKTRDAHSRPRPLSSGHATERRRRSRCSEQGGEAASSSSLLESIVARGAVGETGTNPRRAFDLSDGPGRLFCCLAARRRPYRARDWRRRVGARDDRTRTHSHALDTGGGSAGRYQYGVRAINRPRLTD